MPTALDPERQHKRKNTLAHLFLLLLQPLATFHECLAYIVTCWHKTSLHNCGYKLNAPVWYLKRAKKDRETSLPGKGVRHGLHMRQVQRKGKRTFFLTHPGSFRRPSPLQALRLLIWPNTSTSSLLYTFNSCCEFVLEAGFFVSCFT